jgi:mevalonate kinase
MTDWNEIVEFIHNAMQALDEAHGASEELKQNTNHDTFNAFQVKMQELHEHLSKLKAVLDNEEAFAVDELLDALSRVYSGHEAEYRKTPRMK